MRKICTLIVIVSLSLVLLGCQSTPMRLGDGHHLKMGRAWITDSRYWIPFDGGHVLRQNMRLKIPERVFVYNGGNIRYVWEGSKKEAWDFHNVVGFFSSEVVNEKMLAIDLPCSIEDNSDPRNGLIDVTLWNLPRQGEGDLYLIVSGVDAYAVILLAQ